MVKGADKGVSGGRQDPESDHPYRLSGRTADVIGQLLRAGKPGPDPRRDTRPQLGQYHASPRSLKQPTAAVLLQLNDLPADMWLARPIGRGRLTQAAQFCRVDK